MLASRQAEIDRGPQKDVLELMALMERATAKQEWERAEKLAVQLKSALLRVPEADRAEVLAAVRRVLDRVRSKAMSSRDEVLGKLSEIRRGRDAQRAYAQPGREQLPLR